MIGRPGIAGRIRLRLRARGYWKNGRPDVARFCKEKGYRHQYVYAWLRGRIPVGQNLKQLADDLQVSMAWILFGREADSEASAEVAALELPERTRAARPLPRQARIIGLMDHQFKRLRDLTERLVEAEARTKALEEAAGFLAGTLDLAEVADRIASSVFRLLRVRRSMLYRFDPASGGLVCVAAAGEHGAGGWIGRVLDIGEGVVGRALLERRPIYTSQLLSDPSIVVPEWMVELAEADGLQSAIGVPLSVGGEVVGGLAVGDGPGREFTEEEIDLLSAFAGHAAIAIQNARLFAEAEWRRREAEVLAELVSSINTSLDLDTVLQRVAKGAEELCGSDIGGVAVREPGAEGLVYRYRVGTRAGWDSVRFEPGKGAGGLVLLTGRPFRTDNYAEDLRITKEYLEFARQEGTNALLVVPIRIGQRVEGLLYAVNRSLRLFTDRDEEILLRLADHAAIAIQNARLYAEAERRRREAETLAEVGRNLSQSLDPEKVGQQIVDSVRALIGAEIVSLQRVEEESGALVKLATSMRAGAAYEWNARLTRGSGAVGLAIHQRVPVTSRDVLADARLTFTAEERACLERTSYRAVLAVPLLVHDRVIGGLSIGDRAGRVFEPERERLAQAFAAQAALALDNALLHKEVRDARDFLRAVATNSTDLVVAADLTGRITHVSSGVAGILGYRAAEMVGTSIAGYVREDSAKARALLRRLAAAGQIANYATVFRTKDGKWVEGTATISLLRDTNEVVIGALGVITAPQSPGNGERI
jgi:PAS domain S-box-containing protein